MINLLFLWMGEYLLFLTTKVTLNCKRRHASRFMLTFEASTQRRPMLQNPLGFGHGPRIPSPRITRSPQGPQLGQVLHLIQSMQKYQFQGLCWVGLALTVGRAVISHWRKHEIQGFKSSQNPNTGQG